MSGVRDNSIKVSGFIADAGSVRVRGASLLPLPLLPHPYPGMGPAGCALLPVKSKGI